MIVFENNQSWIDSWTKMHENRKSTQSVKDLATTQFRYNICFSWLHSHFKLRANRILIICMTFLLIHYWYKIIEIVCLSSKIFNIKSRQTELNSFIKQNSIKSFNWFFTTFGQFYVVYAFLFGAIKKNAKISRLFIIQSIKLHW